MFQVNDDLSIYVTRGDTVLLDVAAGSDGSPYTFQPGEVVYFRVFAKKDCTDVVLQKGFPIEDYTQSVEVILDGNDTRIGEVISKPRDYWYEIELESFGTTTTIIGYDEDGAKVFKLFPEGEEASEYVPDPEVIKVIDDEFDMTSERPIQNQVIARAFANLEKRFEDTHAAVAELHVTPQMFGAIGDGKADDTAALQRTVDYAAANNKRVYLPEGKYLISSTVVCNFSDGNIAEFIGCGQKSSIVVSDDFGGDKALYFSIKPTNYRNLDVGNFEVVLTKKVSGVYFDEIGMSAVVHDIFIKGSHKDGDSHKTYGIYANSSTVAEYRNLKINGVLCGLVLKIAHSVHVDKCDISFCKYGVFMSGGSNVSVTRCRIDENTVGLLQNSSSTIATEHRPYAFDGTFIGLTISDNRFESNGNYGILLISYANGYLANNNVNICRNYFTGLDSMNCGIAVARCANIHIAENSFKGTATANTVKSLGSVVGAEFRGNICVMNADGTKCNAELDYSTRGSLDFDYSIETSQGNVKTANISYLRKKVVSEINDGVLDANNYNVIQLETAAENTVTSIEDDNLLYVCKEIAVVCDGKTTFKHSGVLSLKSGADEKPERLKILKFIGVYSDGVRWLQI